MTTLATLDYKINETIELMRSLIREKEEQIQQIKAELQEVKNELNQTKADLQEKGTEIESAQSTANTAISKADSAQSTANVFANSEVLNKFIELAKYEFWRRSDGNEYDIFHFPNIEVWDITANGQFYSEHGFVSRAENPDHAFIHELRGRAENRSNARFMHDGGRIIICDPME